MLRVESLDESDEGDLETPSSNHTVSPFVVQPKRQKDFQIKLHNLPSSRQRAMDNKGKYESRLRKLADLFFLKSKSHLLRDLAILASQFRVRLHHRFQGTKVDTFAAVQESLAEDLNEVSFVSKDLAS